MRRTALLTLSALILLSAACSPKQNESTLSAPDTDKQTSETVNATKNSEPTLKINDSLEIVASEENIKKGKIVFLRCRSCHTLDPGGIHLTGPNLHGLFGAKAGQKDGYAYSDALKAADVTWNEATLSAWLENPQGVIKGNVMAFPGLPDEANRHALIAYLRDSTAE